MTQLDARMMLRSLIENDNNTKSISKVEVIVPEFNENTVLTEATNSNTNIYSNIDFDSAILLCRKWTTINQHDTKLTRAIIENKLETHPDTNDNYMVKKLVMNIFDNVIIFHDLTRKIDELYGPKENTDTMNVRLKKINFASKNREIIVNNLSVLLENKKIFNIVWDILDN